VAIEAVRSEIMRSEKKRGKNAENAKGSERDVLSDVLEAKSLLVSFDFRSEGFAIHLQRERAGLPVPRKSEAASFVEVGDLPGGFSSYSESIGNQGLAERYASRIDDPKLAKALTDTAIRAGVRRVLTCNLPGKLRIYEASEPQLLTLAELAVQGQGERQETKGEAAKVFDYRGFRFYRRDEIIRPAEAKEKEERAKRAMLASLPGKVGESFFDLISERQAETSRSWFGHDDKRFVEVSASDRNAAIKLLDRYLSSRFRIAQDPAFADCRRQLPPRGRELSILRGTTITGVLTKLAFGAEAVSEEEDRSYLGVAAFEDGVLSGYDVWIPVAAARAFGKRYRPLLDALGKSEAPR